MQNVLDNEYKTVKAQAGPVENSNMQLIPSLQRASLYTHIYKFTTDGDKTGANECLVRTPLLINYMVSTVLYCYAPGEPYLSLRRDL